MRAPGVRVTAASTTRRPNGDVVLLVRTEAGPGALVFSAALARQLFVVTNPAPFAGFSRSAETAPAVPMPAPQSESAVAAPKEPQIKRTLEQQRALYELLCREIAAESEQWGARARVLRRHDVSSTAFTYWSQKFGSTLSS